MAGNDQYTSLLLQFETGDGFDDGSQYNHAVTSSSSTLVASTTEFVFGTKSAYFGTGGYSYQILVPSGIPLSFLDGDFTIEGYILAADGGSLNIALFNQYYGSSDYITISCNNTTITFSVKSGGTALATITSSVNFLDVAWNHFAIVRSGKGSNCISIFKNGIKLSCTYTVDLAANSLPTLSAAIAIGGTTGTKSYMYMDEIRISKGIARYTGDFILSPVSFS